VNATRTTHTGWLIRNIQVSPISDPLKTIARDSSNEHRLLAIVNVLHYARRNFIHYSIYRIQEYIVFGYHLDDHGRFDKELKSTYCRVS
jgi:hypothetical protein